MSNEQLENFEELARRAVACKHWRLMPGMLTNDASYRIVSTDYGRVVFAAPNRHTIVEEALEVYFLPDLTDPATVGCLLALVREAWGKPNLYARPEGDYWRMWAEEPGAFVFTTEAAALVDALEAAP